MKNLLTNTMMLATMCAATMLSALPAGAQTRTVKFNIPFAFTAGDTSLSPGQYKVTLDADRMMLLLDPVEGKGPSVVRYSPGNTRSAASSDNGLLRFEKVGERYFLVGVWQPGATEGNSVRLPRKVVESARAGAASESAPSYTDIR